MPNIDKCRVCLCDGAKYSIFENIDSENSIYSKLYQCMQEKIEEKEGYPRNICKSCYDILNTTIDFITKFRNSCKLLQNSDLVVKKESIYNSDDEEIKEEIEVEFCVDEPDTEWLEPWESICELPKEEVKQHDLQLIKQKLKGLKEINFKTKSTWNNRNRQRRNIQTSRVAASILEAELDWNGERWCLRSNLMKEPIEEIPKVPLKKTKLNLPKLPTNTTCLCDICGEIFKSRDIMIRHLKHQHLNVPTECPECHKVLKSQQSLNTHLKRVHAKKIFPCENCQRRFTSKSEFNSHVKKIHPQVWKKVTAKHKCSLCDQGFINNKSLIIHKRSAHTGERPAECIVCGARFFHEDYLKEHLRLHTGETPFQCPVCGRGYAQRGNMKSHLSHNHRLEDISPEILKTIKPSWFKYIKKP